METLFDTEPLDQFITVSQEILNNLCECNENASQLINSNVTEAARQEIKQLIINCNFDINEVYAVVKAKPWDQDKVNHFLTILQERRIDLLYGLLTHGNSSHGESYANFNWVLKLVLGSSELKSLKYPLLQLMFITKTSNGTDNHSMYELNKEILSKFISILENIE